MELRIATTDDIAYISQHLRESDKKEIWASHRRLPQDLLLLSFESFCAADARPFCLFGCNEERNVGVPWLLATDEINFHSTFFLRQSRRILALWLDNYEMLTNYIHAENTLSIEWLKWLGFDFMETLKINDEDFIRFEKRCKICAIR